MACPRPWFHLYHTTPRLLCCHGPSHRTIQYGPGSEHPSVYLHVSAHLYCPHGCGGLFSVRLSQTTQFACPLNLPDHSIRLYPFIASIDSVCCLCNVSAWSRSAPSGVPTRDRPREKIFSPIPREFVPTEVQSNRTLAIFSSLITLLYSVTQDRLSAGLAYHQDKYCHGKPQDQSST